MSGDVPGRLRLGTLGLAVLLGGGLAIVAPVATGGPLRGDAFAWGVVAVAGTAALFGYVGSSLPHNRPAGRTHDHPVHPDHPAHSDHPDPSVYPDHLDHSDHPVHPSLGVANGLTLLRGVLFCAVGGFVVATPSHGWLPAVLFAVAALLDVVDGTVARRTRTTELGERLDPAVDALGVLLGAAAAVALDALPAWYLLAGGLWFGYIGSLWLRRRRGRAVFELPPSRLRGPIGAAQMVVIAAALVPTAPTGAVTVAAAIALVVLVASFLRDWLAATGRLDRVPPGARRAPVAPTRGTHRDDRIGALDDD